MTEVMREVQKKIKPRGAMWEDVKTKGRVTDPDVRALYVIVAALDQSTPRMKKANLAFVADRLGYELAPKKGRTND